MSSQRKPPAELLPVMAAAFPHTFFADPKQVQPLKIEIDRDLSAVLSAGITPYQMRRFLYWYVNRLAYQQALLEGKGRINLIGTVVESEIPTAIREQARERWQQLQATRQNAKSAKPTGTRQSAKPGQRVAAAVPALASTNHLEELYAMAIDAKLELTLKFSTLPNAQSIGQGKMAFALKIPDGQYITVEVSNKIWTKLVKAAEDWPSWIAALSGTMGARTEKGFSLANPGLQVFEKKAKEAPTTPMTDTPPAPASAAKPVTTPPPAAPATVTTKAGTATVTVTKRAPLSLKRDAST